MPLYDATIFINDDELETLTIDTELSMDAIERAKVFAKSQDAPDGTRIRITCKDHEIADFRL